MAFALSCITPSPKAKPFFLACSASILPSPQTKLGRKIFLCRGGEAVHRFECIMCLLAGHITSAFRWRKGEGIRRPGGRGGEKAVRSLVQLRITTCKK